LKNIAIKDMLRAHRIIDIQIAVHSLDEMKIIAIPVLQKLGYEYTRSESFLGVSPQNFRSQMS
jgi:hypothetical protein